MNPYDGLLSDGMGAMTGRKAKTMHKIEVDEVKSHHGALNRVFTSKLSQSDAAD
jgi:hypothetical protein